jgi:uncharacterized protein (DUF1697 family)
MSKTQYLALLRGINVGGNNVIKMVDLKTCFESMGFAEVTTYIQSGNVLFSSEEQDTSKLTHKIEQVLSEQFNYQSLVVVLSYGQLENVVKKAPENFGSNHAEYRYDVLFLKEPLTAEDAIKNIRLREGVDQAYQGEEVLYTTKLISKAGKSYLTKIISLPMYKFLTIRNWNTTLNLFVLMHKNHVPKAK